ncbi:MAG TPA: serpin family protein, partial [Opitutaceae bacterium]
MANHIPLVRSCAALLLVLTGTCCMGADPAAQEAAKSTAALGVDLYRLLAPQEGNLFLSPYSITEALALVSDGAAGKTQGEILHALHWSGPQKDMAAAFAALERQLDMAARDGANLSVANGLWYQRGGAPVESFLEVARDDYRAEVRPVDFIGSSPSVSQEINDWVSAKTLGKITGLFPPGSISGSARLVLANAVYFKGRWENPFREYDTSPHSFFLTADRSIQVPTMESSAKLQAATMDDCSLLALPYAGGDLSMVIVLPKARGGLSDLEQQLSPDKLGTWLQAVDSAGPWEVHVRLPKFKVSYAAELTGPLRQLGMTSAFTPGQADFSGIDGGRDLLLSALMHKAYVEVNEEGTVAAAATGGSFSVAAVETP